jgi:hypothetical protein
MKCFIFLSRSKKNLIVLILLCLLALFIKNVIPKPLEISVSDELVDCVAGVKETTCFFINSPVILSEISVVLPQQSTPYRQVVNEISFVDSQGRSWVAPEKTFTDGASIPDIFIPLIGERDDPSFVNAAVLHDAYCGAGNESIPQYHSFPWEQVHRMFYNSLRVNGTPEIKAKVMFAAVYLGGPRWDEPKRSFKNVPKDILIQEMKWCIEFIETKNPSINEIKEWMRGREAGILSGSPVKPDFATL